MHARFPGDFAMVQRFNVSRLDHNASKAQPYKQKKVLPPHAILSFLPQPLFININHDKLFSRME
jgi:hypothetical protein